MTKTKRKKIIQHVLPKLKNWYFMTSLFFIVWMSFIDKNDLISQHSYRKQLNKLKTDQQYYIDEIKNNKEKLYELMSNQANLEKFAREKYLMKKDDEDIFVLVYNDPKKEEKYVE